ncbi:MAG: tetratricopeptide repeat protein [Flavobacteriaceae bacterium]
MKPIIMLFMFFMAVCAHAQNDVLFEQANQAYNEGNYDKAVGDYLDILGKGEHSAALYYNLGNSYYKLNKIAPSIYYYEKALLLTPNDAEIKNNLAYAQNMTLDAIEPMPEMGFSTFYRNLTGMLSFDQWAYTAVLFMMLFVGLYIAFYYFRYATRKRIAFILSMLSLLLSMATTAFAYLQYEAFQNDRPAIVFSSEVEIKSEPNNRSQGVFMLHEGAKVNVLEDLDDYHKISIADGKTGWVPKESIKLLKDF